MSKFQKVTLFFALLVSGIFFSTISLEDQSENSADKVFLNGKIIALDKDNTIAEAIAVKDGKVLLVGKTSAIRALVGNKTEVIDLGGKSVVPGFVDGHSHFLSLSRTKAADLSSPPVGPVKRIADIIEALKKYKEDNNVKPGEWIRGSRYDQDQLAEGRHPTKEDLDAAFPDNPVIIGHVSGHMSVVNSYAFKISGVDEHTQDPAGGQIVRKKGSREPAGLLLEGARSVIKTEGREAAPSIEEQLDLLDEQQKLYASHGITTAQNGSTPYTGVVLLAEAAKRNRLYIDIEALVAFGALKRIVSEKKLPFSQLNNHLKLVGTKIFTDGSPQGKTAFFTQPYLTDVPGCNDHCTGIPTITQDKLNESISYCFENNIQPYVHCNGDAAIDMYIQAVKAADKEKKSQKLRPVVIHSQFVRPDQLDSYKALSMIPALFSNHTFFWGDVHHRNLGQDRAWFISPLKTSIKKGIIATNHTDYGVTPLSQLFLLWTSVNRLSRSGQVIGPDERLTVTEGLRAITINGAYQYGEEKIKGSLEKGKLADLVILSEDPLTVDVGRLKDITVLETVKQGKTIFKQEDTNVRKY